MCAFRLDHGERATELIAFERRHNAILETRHAQCEFGAAPRQFRDAHPIRSVDERHHGLAVDLRHLEREGQLAAGYLQYRAPGSFLQRGRGRISSGTGRHERAE